MTTDDKTQTGEAAQVDPSKLSPAEAQGQAYANYLAIIDGAANALAHLGIERRHIFQVIDKAKANGGLTAEIVGRELDSLDATLKDIQQNLPDDPSANPNA